MTIKRKTLGSYPYLSVLFSTTMALLVIGIFGVLLIFANKLSTIIKENIELHVYLNQGLSTSDEQSILRRFYYQDYVAEKRQVRQIFFIPKDSAAARFTRETGEDFVQFLGSNPLRNAYRIRIHSDFSDKMLLRRIKSELEKIPGVFEVSYTESLVESINANSYKLSLILIGFAVLLILIIYILINNSIKLALYSQRFLIRSMQLVGANSWFIQSPFLIRAFLFGLLAGFIASLLLFGVLQYAYTQIPELQILENIDQILILDSGLIGFGGLIGLVCSFIAVNKYIKMSLNELY